MIETSLGAQYLQAALAKWREANPWASHIPWEEIPPRYRKEIEGSACRAIAISQPVSPVVGVVTCEKEKLAA
jgi:hypothetical protein